MIVRRYAKCDECETTHMLRIGVGGEPVQAHQFACTNCGSEMHVRLELGTGVAFGPNAIEADEEASAPVINLHPNFTFSKDDLHSVYAFPSLAQAPQLLQAALASRARSGLPATLDDLSQRSSPKPPRLTEEWDALRAAWSLTRNGKGELAAKRMKKFLDSQHFYNDLDSVSDWAFQFTDRLTQPYYTNVFEKLFGQLQNVVSHDDFPRFTSYYGSSMSVDHGRRYFDLMKSYLNNFSEFSQVHYLTAADVEIDDSLRSGSANFDLTRMFYGNAFETFTNNIALLALLNYLVEGRKFDEFQSLTLDKYLRLDKASRANAFASNADLIFLVEESDNQLRNSSHHDGMSFNRQSGNIELRSGKGGQGAVSVMSYARYLSRCSKLFFQCMTLFRLELLIAHKFEQRSPL